MKTQTPLLLLTLAFSASTWIVMAQDDNAPPPKGERPPRRERPAVPDRPGAPGGPGAQRPMMVSPLIAALDANRDGVIDEKEIENAPKALKTLDKNSDGKLTMEELRPPRMEGAPGPGAERGPRGPGAPMRRGGPGGPPPGDGPAPRPVPEL